ncbi:YceI family protein [Corynebacterium qintianiae]|uniref:YceI family protein n=1 Tax=Corynebacterium qintianiae TaxID=2709392 RepID=A0A7T0KPR5_9CORY|nr:YceI family protein [Corynebacterium qintianiae]QPK84176.1 YceI family protein [Corynebacterium qintianiae]
MNRQRQIPKPLLIFAFIFIVALAALAIVPVIYALLFGDHGVKTEGISTDNARAATTDVDGTWVVSDKLGPNQTSAGFTFFEILPAEKKVTSGSTRAVDGEVVVEAGTVAAGEITVDMATVTTDNDRRDVNVRRSILNTDEYPKATFSLTEPADVSQLPEDGSVGTVELTGDLTIRGETNSVTHEFEAVRSGDHLVVAGDIPISRSDFGVETPELVAAKIADEGEINIKLNLEKVR